MMDNKGLTLVLDEGRTSTSDFILDVVLEELGIPKEYKPCFGIWLSSPLLHLQVNVLFLMTAGWFTVNEKKLTMNHPVCQNS